MAADISKDTEDKASLNGMRKAAILLLSMDSETSSKVLRLLPRSTVEDVTHEIAAIDLVNPEVSAGVIKEFYSLALARKFVEQGEVEWKFTHGLLINLTPPLEEEMRS